MVQLRPESSAALGPLGQAIRLEPDAADQRTLGAVLSEWEPWSDGRG